MPPPKPFRSYGRACLRGPSGRVMPHSYFLRDDELLKARFVSRMRLTDHHVDAFNQVLVNRTGNITQIILFLH
jgi:hypothetical protein